MHYMLAPVQNSDQSMHESTASATWTVLWVAAHSNAFGPILFDRGINAEWTFLACWPPHPLYNLQFIEHMTYFRVYGTHATYGMCSLLK